MRSDNDPNLEKDLMQGLRIFKIGKKEICSDNPNLVKDVKESSNLRKKLE